MKGLRELASMLGDTVVMPGCGYVCTEKQAEYICPQMIGFLKALQRHCQVDER